MPRQPCVILRNKRPMRALFFPPMLAFASPAIAQDVSGPSDIRAEADTRYSVSIATDYVEGSVGDDQKYETETVTFGIGVTDGGFSAAVSLPYASTSAPEGLVVSQGGLFGTPLLATPTTRTDDVRRSGIGDLTAEAGYSFPLSVVNASINASVKVPTASREKGLGTGKVDYGISGQLSKPIGPVIPFVGAGYKVIGEPSNYDVRNTVAGNAGAQLLLGRSASLAAAYTYTQSASPGIGDNQSVAMGLGANLSQRLRIGIEGAAGLSADAPDVKFGLRVGIGL